MKRLLPLLLPLLAVAQSGPANLGYEEGTAGQVPPGWLLTTPDYSAELRREGCAQGSGCVVIQAKVATPAQPFGNLLQAFNAEPFRGKTIRLRSRVRVDQAEAADRAQMWLRVDRPARQMGLFDNMGNRPITAAEWRTYEISGEVEVDAQQIYIGVMVIGKGKAWVDDVSFEILPQVPLTAADVAARKDIEQAYALMNAAISNGRYDDFAAGLSSGAQLVNGDVRQPFSIVLQQLQADAAKGVRYRSQTAVKSIHLSDSEATVTVEEASSRISADGSSDFVSTSRDTWVKTGDGWKLKETVGLSSHAVEPKFDPETVKPVVAELRQRAVPLSAVTAGSPAQDLSAFGKAVGNARIVALGEASHGTREFFQMKHRLFEYLVMQKGFTVFAIEANWPETLAVDRYIKAGEGDVATAMSQMYFWTWYTEEVRNMIEWMRGFNRAPGKHPTLTFTAFDMQTAQVAAKNALDYLKEYAPAQAAAAAAAYQDIAGLQLNDNRAQSFADRAASVLAIFDAQREALERASSHPQWRDARQAANVAFQACSMRVPGKASTYRDEMMAANVEWLAKEAYPGEKIVLWAHNGHVGFGNARYRGMGSWLRERFGQDLYVLGFAFRKGSLQAIGQSPAGRTALAEHTVPPAPEGSGSSVLGSAGLPLFFLDMASLPEGALVRWLQQSHLYYNVGAIWNTADAAGNLVPEVLPKAYDGIVFVDEGHAARPLLQRR